MYWAGDYNIDILNADHHKATGDFLHAMMSNSFYPAITNPTRITAIMDNIYCNVLKNSFTGILYKNISDDLQICVMNNTKVEKIKETKFIETRDMNKVNISNLKAEVKNYDWSLINSFENMILLMGVF